MVQLNPNATSVLANALGSSSSSYNSLISAAQTSPYLAGLLVAKRINAGDNRLTAVEWKSGTHLCIVDIVAPFGGEAEMREQVDGGS